MDSYLGEIRLFPYNNVPAGWTICEGQLLQISSNPALYSLLGLFYGGDGKTTFALPDLRGRVVVGMGPSTVAGAPAYSLGNTGGNEQVILTLQNIPSHTHAVQASSDQANAAVGTNAMFADVAVIGTYSVPNYYAPPNSSYLVTLSSATVGSAGGGVGHENRQPTLALRYYMMTSGGVYPTQVPSI